MTAIAHRGRYHEVETRVVGYPDAHGDEVPRTDDEAGVVEGLVDTPVFARDVVGVLVCA